MSKHLADHVTALADRLDRLRSVPPGEKGQFSKRLKHLRAALGLSQEAFADTYGISLSNIRNWEQESRGTHPDAAARLLIDMIEAEPGQMAEIVSRTRTAPSSPVLEYGT